MTATARRRIPVTILTGFLGAGKTTLLNRLIGAPGFGDTAVVVNEFGAAGIDGALVAQADERAFALSVGCLCCTVAGDVRLTLLRLLAEAEAGTGPALDRVVIETTGLADPAPILQTFMSDMETIERFALNGIVTLVDAVAGTDALARFEEARRQVAVADLVLLSKTDLAGDATSLRCALAARNPTARVLEARGVGAETLFSLAAFDPAGKPPEVRAWLAFDARAAQGGRHRHAVAGRHDDTASAFCVTAAGPVDPPALAEAIGALQARFGPDLLRVKGLVALTDPCGCPLVVHAVGHVASPPRILDGWPDGIDATRLVVIVSGPGRAGVPDLLSRIVPQLRPFGGAWYPESEPCIRLTASRPVS